ncbi:MAG: RNA polymerase subunit sigma-24 [Polyangiaceae bacterium]|nr:RNA polymerase subunit sigma-24 [Polyangiaceae bacterium]
MSPSAAELVARASYGRLVALLAARSGDIAGAEDALSEAFLAALSRWPVDGAPQNPDAWLFAVARRRLLDGRRRAAVRARDAEAIIHAIEGFAEAAVDTAFPDDRLRLLFVCSHPAIEPAAQVPLMLQTVLGLDAAAIASAMRVAPKTMGQRLWRAKTKIREAGIPFDVPGADELPARLDAVLEAIYAAFGTAWEDVGAADPRSRELTAEAIFLGRLLVALLPGQPEAYGLLALMLFAEARRPARRNAAGDYVPLEQQDRSRWSAAHLDEAEQLLVRAFRLGRVGPFQLEAALQSAHVSGARLGRFDHEAILALYEGLVNLAPSLGALVGRAAALVEARGGEAALAALDALEPSLVRDYQPFWAVRADALRAAGRAAEARDAYDRAAGMTEDEGTRRFLAARRAQLSEVSTT